MPLCQVECTLTEVGVIGATGWIGTALVSQLLRQGVRVRVVARKAASADPGEQMTWEIVGSRPSADELSVAFHGVDALINVAGLAHVPPSHAGDLFANEQLPAELADAAARIGARRFVHLSSIKAVAEIAPSSVGPDQDPHPATTYGRSKLLGEQAARSVSNESATEFVVVRSPMVYGENAPGNFTRLVRAVERRLPVPLPSPYPRRSIAYRHNLVSLLAHLALTDAAIADTVHYADLPHLDTRQLVHKIGDAVGNRPLVVPLPSTVFSPVADVLGKQQDWRRLTQDLVVRPSSPEEIGGWRPPFDDHIGFNRSLGQPS